MQSRFPLICSICLFLIHVLTGCGDPPRARLVLTVNPGKTVKKGQTITVDASQSSYDSIEWKIGTAIWGPCNTRPSCHFNYDNATSKNIFIKVEMERRPQWSGIQTHQATSDSAIVPLSWTN
ncbi:MAG: hypothetical protein QF560_07840 [SAR324 cluster bacterium]|nr:hypothetical protein [SAR324 cluster bacterium]MEE1577031.1 hypothetical protein [Deltaproteobacteria bacterium]MDP6246856.1 hypothetical protein [SAR324 cluster bacterium]MDP6465709.1 hypothetical protein [SAR324 cluster bacterium]MDP7138267.1 hypothetical protein [SAR324 cluster bacterium]